MNPTLGTAAAAAVTQQSVFAGLDVCGVAGLALPTGAARPLFEDEVWDFTDVIGLPVQMPLANRRFDFTAILESRWRVVARNSSSRSWPRGIRRWHPCPGPPGHRCTCELPRVASTRSPHGSTGSPSAASPHSPSS